MTEVIVTMYSDGEVSVDTPDTVRVRWIFVKPRVSWRLD